MEHVIHFDKTKLKWIDESGLFTPDDSNERFIKSVKEEFGVDMDENVKYCIIISNGRLTHFASPIKKLESEDVIWVWKSQVLY